MRRRDFIAGPIADALGPLEISSGRLMAISMDMQKTFRVGAVFSKSFNAFGRHAVVFILLSTIAHLPEYLWSSGVAVHFVTARALLSPWADLLVPLVGLVCVLIAYGAIIYGVIQHLAARPMSVAGAVAIAARRLSPLAGVLVAVVALIGLARGLVLLEFLTEAAGTKPAVALSKLIAVLVSWLVMAMYFMVAPVCVAEQAGVGAAMSRCRFLTKGHRWQIFGTILLVSILDFAISIIGAFVATHLAPTDQLLGVINAAINGIWFVLGAFNAVMAAVFYDRLTLGQGWRAYCQDLRLSGAAKPALNHSATVGNPP